MFRQKYFSIFSSDRSQFVSAGGASSNVSLVIYVIH